MSVVDTVGDAEFEAIRLAQQQRLLEDTLTAIRENLEKSQQDSGYFLEKQRGLLEQLLKKITLLSQVSPALPMDVKPILDAVGMMSLQLQQALSTLTLTIQKPQQWQFSITRDEKGLIQSVSAQMKTSLT